MRPLRILTWQAHGSYLHALSQLPHELHLMTDRDVPENRWLRGSNMHPVPVAEAHAGQFDCILFHQREQYLDQQYRYLTAAQRRLPRIYVEHAAPGDIPGGTRHPVDDTDVLLVHVTAGNALMWDNGRQRIRVIDYGVMVSPDVGYSGERQCGAVLSNALQSLADSDIYQRLRQRIPLEVVPARCPATLEHDHCAPLRLPATAARCRFLFHPVRSHTLDPGIIAGMMNGMPVIGLASGEMTGLIQNGVSGYVDTDLDKLAAHMQELLDNPPYAFALGCGARRRARERFGMPRFVADWNATLQLVTHMRTRRSTD